MTRVSPRVCLFLPDLTGGGAERIMVNLAGGLTDLGVDVDLVLAKADGPYLEEVAPKVNVIDCRARGVAGAVPHLVRYLRAVQPSAMLATLPHANLVALTAAALAGGRTRTVLREANVFAGAGGAGWRGRAVRSLMPRLYPSASAIVAVSCEVARDLVSVVGVNPERVSVLPNPVVSPALRALSLEEPDHPWLLDERIPVVLGVGRLVPQKDFGTLIRAFAKVRRRRPARLVILGEGMEREGLLGLARSEGVEADVSLPGFVANPYAYMRRAAVLALSSIWEGLPAVLIQAMACGCPVVTTDCPGGCADIVDQGRFGALVPVGDADALAGSMERVLAGERGDPCALRQRAQAYSIEAGARAYAGVLLGDEVVSALPSPTTPEEAMP